MRILKMGLLPLMCGFTLHASAQTRPDTLKISSLDAVIDAAVTSNPTQAVYLEQIKQARFDHKASGGFYYPQASANFNGTDNMSLAVTPVPGELFGQPGKTIDVKFGKHYVYNTGVTLSQSIFDWTSVMQAKIARDRIRLAELQQEAYVQTLKEEVARYYYTALIAKTALAINALDEKLGSSVVLLTGQRLQAGSADRIALNQAQINANSILQNKWQSQQLYDQSIENLKILLGKAPAAEVIMLDTLNMDSLVSADVTAVGADRSLEVYRQKADIAALQSKSQQSAAFPKISASAFFGNQQFRNDFGLSFSQDSWKSYSYIGLGITVPIFTGFSNTNKYKSQKAQQQVARLEFDNAQQQSLINDRLLLKNYSDYRQMVTASYASFKLYGENLKLNDQKYKEGVISLDVYQKVFQDYLAAENVYLNNLSLLLSTQSTLVSRK
ncbi:outer membrane protein TolC [Mucilaginibacter oryzae]|uniref:Outer membrane protein TolC n=1 Tax=Mucilaginibacter oryzae TaxID=468058 RepID=A0A316HD94_9SPHI|nr:TolC family protein [Mucilaginibacter oryzae]PWK79199.1 outer membrane protein TolC [Mucilaginibacter oryzae]